MKMRKKKSMSETPEQKPNILEGQKRFSKNPFKKSNLDDEVKANSDKVSVNCVIFEFHV